MLSLSTVTHHLLSAEPELLSAVLPNPWSISKVFGTSCYTFKQTREERHHRRCTMSNIYSKYWSLAVIHSKFF